MDDNPQTEAERLEERIRALEGQLGDTSAQENLREEEFLKAGDAVNQLKKAFDDLSKMGAFTLLESLLATDHPSATASSHTSALSNIEGFLALAMTSSHEQSEHDRGKLKTELDELKHKLALLKDPPTQD